MSNDTGKSLVAYGVALVAVAVAALVRWLLDPWLGVHLPFPTMYAAVAVAVWAGGFRPGVFAALIGALVGYRLFIEPHGDAGLDWAGDFIGLALYLLSCGVI